MDFSLTEEQQLLRDSIARFVANEYTFEARRKIIDSASGWSDSAWTTFAAMGLLGAPFDERYGGFGGTPVDVMVIMQELGRGMVVEPYLATVVLGGGLIAEAGTAAQKDAILPHIATGKRLLALAYGEPQSRYDAHDVLSTATRDGSGYLLNGRKSVVLHGGAAHTLVVSARTAGSQRDDQGVTLFLVDANARGVTTNAYRTIDGRRAADIALDQVRVDAEAAIGDVDAGVHWLQRVIDLGVVALCAEAVGVMEALNAATLDYLKTRQQFGQPIGRFQALQHRAVDMLMHCEQSKSITLHAAVKASRAVDERRRAASAAKSLVGRAGRAIAKEAIQLHGGMGVTDELPAAHFAKHLTMIDCWLGDSDWHTERFATLS
jgi:alkylation response protein AidB-like acyl-CoA dehydrogenase